MILLPTDKDVQHVLHQQLAVALSHGTEEGADTVHLLPLDHCGSPEGIGDSVWQCAYVRWTHTSQAWI